LSLPVSVFEHVFMYDTIVTECCSEPGQGQSGATRPTMCILAFIHTV